MRFGENMPTKKLIDIIDEMNIKEDKILNKFLELSKLIESKNPSMDDSELRWVMNKLDELGDKKKLTRNDLLQANLYWKKYNN
jgi:GTPase involved in cell partitioning and DNA repair